MFTGLVQELGRVHAVVDAPPGKRLVILAPTVSADAAIGDSIAINGCCLTVTARKGDELSFDAGTETLARTNLGRLKAGDHVNLEPSLRVGDRLGGHWVSGHVEATGALVSRSDEGDWSTFRFQFPAELGRYMVSKGSIALDGVSLTLVEVTQDEFTVALVPHTLAVTTLGRLAAGDTVNLETDLLAKYAQKSPPNA